MTFVLREMIRDLLMENRLEKFKELYGSKTSKRPIPEVLLLKIIMGDPTTLPRTAQKLADIKKVGEYAQWLIKQFYKIYPHRNEENKIVPTPEQKEQMRLFFEDLYKATEALQKFDVMKRKNKLPQDKRDINKVATIRELEDMTELFDLSDAQETNAEKKMRVIREDADLVYEDAHYEVIIPKTPEASYELAGPPLTRWCTASSQRDNYHNKYSKDGPLYIIRDKQNIVESGKGAGEPRPILQIHFHSDQFMDRTDAQVNVKEFFRGKEGLKQFFRKPFEAAVANLPFNMNSGLWYKFLSVYGADGNTRKIILDALKIQVSQRPQLKVVDRSGGSTELDVTPFIQLLDYRTVFEKVLEFAHPDVTRLEFMFRNYHDEGLDVPQTIGRFQQVKNLMLAGFVKSLPATIGTMKNLTFLVISDNPNLHHVPEEVGQCPLEVYNSMKTPAPLPKSIERKEAEDELFLTMK